MSAKVLVVNAGSSSLKYKLFEDGARGLLPLVSGLAERIGEAGKSRLVSKIQSSDGASAAPLVLEAPMADHTVAMRHVIAQLTETYSSKIRDEVRAVGHRVVHGGSQYSAATLIDESVKSAIRSAATLAPLHNPPNLAGIEAASALFRCPHVAVFDTAFHMTIPPRAHLYALPRSIIEQKGIRKYGFHGTSYRYLTQQAADLLQKRVDQVNLIICHLGAGSSMCAVQGGKSIDTTMGVTPLEGLVMATRSGDVDPAVPLMLQSSGTSAADVDNMLNKQSGLYGLCGKKDMRAILEAADAGDRHSKEALDVFVHRVRKYLGAYYVALEGKVDGIVFSAGIGENAPRVRAPICAGLERLGIRIDADKNTKAVGGVAADISAAGAQIKVLVVPTDEELSIATQAIEAIAKER